MSGRRQLAFVAAGVAIAAVFGELTLNPAPLGGAPHLIRMAIASVAYAVAVALLFLEWWPGRRLLMLCFALALLARVPLVIYAPGPGHDAHRYIWDARLQRAGLNPYVVRPDDPAFDRLHTPQTQGMNNKDVPSPYPPVAQYFFRAVTAVHDSVIAIKVALTLAEVATVALLWTWFAGRAINPAWTLVYAWHPVVIFETGSGAHLDALGVMLLLGALLALSRGRPMLGVLAATASVAVKFLPIVLVPALLRHVRWRHAAAGAVFFGLLYLPFLDRGRIPEGAVGAVVDRFRFNQWGFDVVERLVGARPAAAAAVLAGLLITAAIRPSLVDQTPAKWAWPLAVSLMLSPVIYPWYLTWLVPFLIGRAGLPLLVWSLSVIATYQVWDLYQKGQPWIVPTSTLVCEYALVAAVGATLLVSRLRDAGAAARRQDRRLPL